jgi:hypothetical protein
LFTSTFPDSGAGTCIQATLHPLVLADQLAAASIKVVNGHCRAGPETPAQFLRIHSIGPSRLTVSAWDRSGERLFDITPERWTPPAARGIQNFA